MRISARKLLQYKTEDLWDKLKGEFSLVFDDGEILTNAKQTIYSHHAWGFHRLFPDSSLTKRHHIKTIMGEKKLDSGTHIQLLSNVVWDIYKEYREKGTILDINLLSRLIYEVSNNMYNQLSVRLEGSVVSLDIIDAIEILNFPKVKTVLSSLSYDQESIAAAYAVLNSVLNSKELLPKNPIVKASQAKLIKQNQVLQCLGPRGFLTDIDSHIFPVPIMRGYAIGMRRFHDSMIESRSSSKSLYFSKSDLQEAEYFSRKLQLLCQVVKRLHPGDCGSTKYLAWRVRAPVYDGSKKISDGDLSLLVGKYYLDEATGKHIPITANDTHLEGKLIKIRSVVAGCAHQDPYGICSVCFGELSVQVPSDTNIGQLCSSSLTQLVSQNILSTKHFDNNALAQRIVLTPEEQKYLKVSASGSNYQLSDNLKGKKVKLVIPCDEALGLTDIAEVSDVEKLGITRVSEITAIGVIINNDEYEEKIPVYLAVGKRKASLTFQALSFIKEKGWSIDEKGNYVISLDGWNFNDDIFLLPAIHFNMSDVGKKIGALLESSMEELSKKQVQVPPEAILLKLYDLVNKYMQVNLAVLEVSVLGVMVRSVTHRDFRLPKSFTNRAMGVTRLTIPNRSMSAAMAFQEQDKTLTNPMSFFKDNRPSHPMDVFLCPRETLSDKNR